MWEQLENQGLGVIPDGSGTWGVSTLQGYYDRGQKLDVPTAARYPQVKFFEGQGARGEAIAYAMGRARSAKGTNYYVLRYEDDEGDPRFRVLRTHAGHGQSPEGIRTVSREKVMVFRRMINPREDAQLLPDGRIRWILMPKLTTVILEPDEEREMLARSRGKLQEPQKPAPERAKVSLPFDERIRVRGEAEGLNAREIEDRIQAILKHRSKLEGLAAMRTPDDEDAVGTCYEDAVVALLFQKLAGFVLVHGHPTLSIAPHCQFGHAWLENADFVLDTSNNLVIPKAVYYEAGKIDYLDNRIYTPAEARAFLLFRKIYGPWEGPDADPPSAEEIEEWLEDHTDLPFRSLDPVAP
jgi:hypothetical protein